MLYLLKEFYKNGGGLDRMITLVVSGIDWTEALGSDIAGAAVQLPG